MLLQAQFEAAQAVKRYLDENGLEAIIEDATKLEVEEVIDKDVGDGTTLAFVVLISGFGHFMEADEPETAHCLDVEFGFFVKTGDDFRVSTFRVDSRIDDHYSMHVTFHTDIDKLKAFHALVNAEVMTREQFKQFAAENNN